MPALYQALFTRRSASAKHLVAPGPDEATIATLLAAAAHAPDHGRLAPFRFIRIREESRPRFAEVLAAAALQEKPDLPAAEVERAREKAFQAPCLIAFIARIDADHPKIPASDQWLSAGCALENLLLAATAKGVAAAVRSGKALEMPAVRSGFALAANEHFCCFLALGTASEWPPQKPKPDVASLTSHW